MITLATFRQDYPEFASVALYQNSAVAYWTTVAGLLLRTERWGVGSTAATAPPTTVLDVATELFVAHNLAIEKMAQDAAKRGGTPGVSQGPVSSKSVGGVSISYDTTAGIDKDAGHWNLTTYGTRLHWLMLMFGAGPVQVGIGCDPFGWFGAGGSPYIGPDPWPGQTSFG